MLVAFMAALRLLMVLGQSLLKTLNLQITKDMRSCCNLISNLLLQTDYFFQLTI